MFSKFPPPSKKNYAKMKKKPSGIIVLILAIKRDIKRLNSFIGYREKHVVESEYTIKYSF